MSGAGTGPLAGQAAVVTGASGGIGSAIALALAAGGARVLVHFHRSRERAAAVVDRIRQAGGEAEMAGADVRRPAEVGRLVRRAVAQWGRVDVWVNNAGTDILTGDHPAQPELARLEQLWQVDVKGTLICCRAVAPVMQRQGSGLLINMAWDHAEHGMAGPEAELYAAAKGAVWAFSRSLARSLAPAVRVNVLAPGWIRTAFLEHSIDPADRDRIARETPLRRLGSPDDVAAAAVFLASPGAAFMTGQAMVVNGGVVMR